METSKPALQAQLPSPALARGASLVPLATRDEPWPCLTCSYKASHVIDSLPSLQSLQCHLDHSVKLLTPAPGWVSSPSLPASLFCYC